MSDERDFLTRQIAATEQQLSKTLAAAEQCRGALQVCRSRLAMLDRAEAERTEDASRRIPVEANGEVD